MAQEKIGFIGYESADIILYIARMLSYVGKKVAVIDRTDNQTVVKTIPLPEELSGTGGYYKNILITSDTACEASEEALDVVLYSFGYHLQDAEIKECKMVVYVTDMIAYNAQLLKDVELPKEVDTFLIVRNAIPLKYDEKYLANIIGRKFKKDNIFRIPYEEADYKSRCYLYVDKKHKLTSLSGQMQVTIFELLKNITKEQYGRKERAVLFKRA